MLLLSTLQLSHSFSESLRSSHIDSPVELYKTVLSSQHRGWLILPSVSR